MLQYLNQKRGQSILEYAILIVIVSAALLSIQFYIKRGLQGHLKQNADDIGDQYSDGNTNVLVHTRQFSNSEEKFLAGRSSSKLNGPDSTNTTKNSIIIKTDQEYFGS